MSQTPKPQVPSRKKTLLSVLVLLLLTCVIVYVFKDNWADIASALGRLSLWQVMILLAVGITSPLMDGTVTWLMVGSRLPGFRLRQGVDVSWLGQFGNVATFGAGVMPMQTYYLYRCGLDAGPALGLITLQYSFHKAAVLCYATVLLLFERGWLAANTTGVIKYLPAAYVVVAAIVLALVLLCTAPIVQNLARRLLGLLPNTEKWQARRAAWLEQLDNLGEESRRLLANKPLCAKVFAAQMFKLFLLFLLPYLCMKFMHLPEMGFWRAQLLAALVLFLSNALPNLAGMGSIETAFFVVFGSFLSRADTVSALMLYRIASYYFVFLCSTVGFFRMQRRVSDMPPRN